VSNALNDQGPDVWRHIPEPLGRHCLEDVVQAGHLRVAALNDLLERGHAVTACLHHQEEGKVACTRVAGARLGWLLCPKLHTQQSTCLGRAPSWCLRSLYYSSICDSEYTL